MIEKTGLLEFHVLCSLSVCVCFYLNDLFSIVFSTEHDSMRVIVDGKWA